MRALFAGWERRLCGTLLCVDTLLFPARATVEESYEIVDLCRHIETDRQARVLDASRCERFGPMGTALLAMALERRRIEGLTDLSFVQPTREECREFLAEIGFERFFLPKESRPKPTAGGTLQMRQLHGLDPLYTESVAELLLHNVQGTSEEASFLVQLCLNELLQNVFEHAESQVGAFVHSRWYRHDGNVRVTVADAGIGIPAALRRRYVRDLQRESDDKVLIAAVTELGLTSRQAGRPGGRGLKHLHSLVTERGGRMSVISQQAWVVFTSKRPVKRRAPFFRGTAIEIDFRPDAAPTRSSPEVL